MQDPKNAIWTPSHNFVGLYLRNWGTYRQSERNLLSSNTSPTCPYNIVNFGLLAAEIFSLVWGTQLISTGFARHSSTGHQGNFVALNRGRHLYLAGRPSRWALAHILVRYDFSYTYAAFDMECHLSFLRCHIVGMWVELVCRHAAAFIIDWFD